jgi:hypothetical protein
MIWDAVQRRYEDSNGRALTPAEIKKHIQDFIKSEQALITKEAERLTSDEITVAEFFAFMRQKITAIHQIAGTVAYGGEAQMTRERQRRINEKILSELEYLNEFEVQAERSFAAIDVIADKVAKDAKERVA